MKTARTKTAPHNKILATLSHKDTAMSVDNMKLESLALHHGYTSEATTKAAAVPIYQTTSYTFDDTDHAARRGR